MAIALWFSPSRSSAVHDTLHSLILSLQTLFPDAVLFEPHLTLTSQLNCNTAQDVETVLTSCVAAVQSIRAKLKDEQLVSFTGVSIGKKYFDKVRLDCPKNRYLCSIAQVMRELYVASSAEEASNWVLEEFHPHVSLVYSDVYHVDQALSRVLQQRIEDALDLSMYEAPHHRREGDQTTWTLDRHLPGWSVPGTFKIVRCEGPVSEWQVLGSADV